MNKRTVTSQAFLVWVHLCVYPLRYSFLAIFHKAIYEFASVKTTNGSQWLNSESGRHVVSNEF